MAAETTMVKLIKGLIASGALKPEDGQALLVQAEAEAAAAQRTAATAPATASGGVALEAGDVRVPYVPQSVRDGIRDEVRQDVMAQARSEGWAAPNEVAEWTKRIKVTGDMRVRSESRFSERNSDIVSKWSSINSGNGFDTNTNTNLQLPPLLNTRQTAATCGASARAWASRRPSASTPRSACAWPAAAAMARCRPPNSWVAA